MESKVVSVLLIELLSGGWWFKIPLAGGEEMLVIVLGVPVEIIDRAAIGDSKKEKESARMRILEALIILMRKYIYVYTL